MVAFQLRRLGEGRRCAHEEGDMRGGRWLMATLLQRMQVALGQEDYFVGANGYLIAGWEGAGPPDLRYF
jgi:hypothetical protein